MMQRLQFEEAQQSSYAITPAREGSESRDESQSESLAAEFQSLLAQIIGQVVAIPDQGTALSFALAQTVAPEHAPQQVGVNAELEDESSERGSSDLMGGTNDHTDGTGAGSVANRGQASLDSRQSLGDSMEKESIQDGALEVIPTVVSQLIEEEISQVVPGVVSKESYPTLLHQFEESALAGGISGLDGVLSEPGGEISIERVAAEAGADTAVEQQVMLGDISPHMTVDEVSEAANRVMRKMEKGIKSDFSGYVTEGENFELTTGTGSDEPPLRENVRKVPVAGKIKAGEAAGFESSKSSIFEPTVTNHQHPIKGFSETRVAEQANTLNSLQHQGALDRAKKDATNEGLLKSVQSEQIFMPSDPKRNESRSDGAIQMVLLRQAFESLRAAKNDSGELARLRSQSQTVQAVGAAAETKSAQGEQTSRGKPLTRPQIARMMERVESSLKEAARSRDGKTLSLRLEPVDLGKVKVDVSLREGMLHARITPENQQVLQALREHAHELQGALRNLGLEVDSVTVSITSEEFSGEMTTGQETMDGRSFQDDRNNMPQERPQVPETTIGNELAPRSAAGGDPERSGARNVTDHWIA